MALAIFIAFSFHRRRLLQTLGAISLCLIFPATADVISVTDVSQVGFVTDPDKDGIANQKANNQPTPFSFTSKANIAVAKYSGNVVPVGDGWLTVDIHVVVKNIGDVAINDLELLSKLVEQLPTGAQFRIKRIRSNSDDHPINPDFDGDQDPQLLVPGGKLTVGQSFDLFYELTFLPTTVESPLKIAAAGSAKGPHNKTVDDSFDSKLPKDNEDGPTLIAFNDPSCDIDGRVFHDLNQDGRAGNEESINEFPICVALYDSTGEMVDNALADKGEFSLTANKAGLYEIEIGQVKGSQCHIGTLPDTWRYLSSEVKRVQVGSGKQCLSTAKAPPAFPLLEGSEVNVVAYLENGLRGSEHFDGIQHLSEQAVANVTVTAYCKNQRCAEDTTLRDGRVAFILPSNMLNPSKDMRFQVSGPDGLIALPIRTTDPLVDRLKVLEDGVEIRPSAAKTTIFQPLVKANVLIDEQTVEGVCRKRLLAPHTYTANGPGSVEFSVQQTSGGSGWRYHIHRDENCDGVLQAGDSEIKQAISMDIAASSPEPSQVCVLVAAIAPACTSSDITAKSKLVATYAYLNTDVTHETAVNEHWLAQRSVELDADVKISKTVWNATHDREGHKAAPCEVLEYRVTYVNQGEGPARNLVIRDRVGEWSLLHQAPYCGKGVNCTPKIDSGEIGKFATVSWVINDVVEPGDTGYVVYRTHVDSNKVCEYEEDNLTPK